MDKVTLSLLLKAHLVPDKVRIAKQRRKCRVSPGGGLIACRSGVAVTTLQTGLGLLGLPDSFEPGKACMSRK